MREIHHDELEKWQDYLIGKPCPIHGATIKAGRYGNWCGKKTELGTWCDGGWPTEEWLNNLRGLPQSENQKPSVSGLKVEASN